jgi:hypothetical protein
MCEFGGRNVATATIELVKEVMRIRYTGLIVGPWLGILFWFAFTLFNRANWYFTAYNKHILFEFVKIQSFLSPVNAFC